MNKNNISESFQNKNKIADCIKINLGIQILRCLLCFWIIIIHCSSIKQKHEKYFSKQFHVPTFFFISFYFYYPIIYNKNKSKVISRFQRLLLPYLFWPIIRIIFKLKQRDEEYSLRNIFLQLLIGCPIHGIFWFQFIILIIFFFRKILPLPT